MNFVRYKELLADKEVRWLLLVGMIARIPHSASGILLTLHVVLTLGKGFAAAGAAAALFTIGMAVGAPWRGRRVDVAGLRVALIPSIVSEAVIWTVLPHVSYEWILPLALVGGAFSLPIFSVIRQSLGVLVHDEKMRTAYALDSIATEMVFMIGPAVAAVAATGWSTVWGMTLVGWLTALAGLFLVWMNPPTRSEVPEADEEEQQRLAAECEAAEHAVADTAVGNPQGAAGELLEVAVRRSTVAGRRRGSRLPRPFSWITGGLLALFLTAAGAGLVLSGTDVSVVGLLRQQGHESELGIVFFFWCASSMVGGLVYGAMKRKVSPMLLLLAMAVLTIPMGFAQDTWSLALLSNLPGFLCAPVLSATSEYVAEMVEEQRRGEAMGWYGSFLTAGTALGSPMTGVFIDMVGPWSGFVVIGVAGVLLVLVATGARMLRRRLASV
ncbi:MULTISPECIES: MFS transporter [Arthrobacter]|uniref:MFS transporter n=2 Tax=Arthrobacter TaxID=1663 RepID=A0ABU9KM59_9MICC|nr:MFS transporter [Arthrobacter sp. YJM1]MDP5227872.1 MFS transporter [Arthrobacter sp. YJM1]